MDPQLQGQIRSLIITVGSIIASQGYLTGFDWTAVAGAIVTVAGFVWSWVSNSPSSLVEQAARSDKVQEINMTTQKAADSFESGKVAGPHPEGSR